MVVQRNILLVESSGEYMQRLSTRLRRLGYGVLETRGSIEVQATLRQSRHGIGAAVVPANLGQSQLHDTLEGVRNLAPAGGLTVLATGTRPATASRDRLRAAGIEFGLWDPLDQHTLRFQINRALAGRAAGPRERGTLRAPADWTVRIRSGARDREASIYSISARGAYLETPRPWLPNTALQLTLPLPTHEVVLGGRVIMTNVPGNLMRKNLPLGMGVRFANVTPETQAALHSYAQDRARALKV